MHTPFTNLQEPALVPGDLETLGLTLAPELEDTIEYIEQGDYVRIERLVKPDGAPAEYGHVLRTNPHVQYALVKPDNRRPEWFHIDEVFLVLKAAALNSEPVRTSAMSSAR